MKISIFFLAAVLMLGGCARKGHWEATSYAELPFEKSDAECKFEGEKAMQNSPYRGNPFIMASDKVRVYESCMVSKGYIGVYDD